MLMNMKRSHDIVRDEARRDRAVVYSVNGNRNVLKTSGKTMPIGERLGDAGRSRAAIYERERADGFSIRERERNRNKEMVRRLLRAVDVRRETETGGASRRGYPHAVVQTDVRRSPRRGGLSPCRCRELRGLKRWALG